MSPVEFWSVFVIVEIGLLTVTADMMANPTEYGGIAAKGLALSLAAIWPATVLWIATRWIWRRYRRSRARALARLLASDPEALRILHDNT